MTITLNGVKKSLSKSAQKILKNQKQPPAPTLFFGNLSFDTTEDSIRELLEAHREKGRQKERSKEEKGDGKEEPWIRKVRLSTFEDSGKCKGCVCVYGAYAYQITIAYVCRFAFVDFITTELATSALVNLRNHRLNGRDLVVEYASAEAVRRGTPKGPNPKSSGNADAPTDRAGRKPKAKDTSSQKPRVDEKDKLDMDTLEEDGSQSVRKSVQSATGEYRGRKPKGRPKPGAALAFAKRESAAIVPSRGQKITF